MNDFIVLLIVAAVLSMTMGCSEKKVINNADLPPASLYSMWQLKGQDQFLDLSHVQSTPPRVYMFIGDSICSFDLSVSAYDSTEKFGELELTNAVAEEGDLKVCLFQEISAVYLITGKELDLCVEDRGCMTYKYISQR